MIDILLTRDLRASCEAFSPQVKRLDKATFNLLLVLGGLAPGNGSIARPARSHFMAKLFADREDIEKRVKAGREAMDRTLHLVEKRVGPVMSTRRAQVASGVIIAAVVMLGVGMLVYRRRRHPTFASRIEKVIPDELRPSSIRRAFG
jgi:hypothetical protein